MQTKWLVKLFSAFPVVGKCPCTRVVYITVIPFLIWHPEIGNRFGSFLISQLILALNSLQNSGSHIDYDMVLTNNQAVKEMKFVSAFIYVLKLLTSILNY